MSTHNIFGIEFEICTLDEAVSSIITAACERRKGLVVTPNVDHIITHHIDEEFRSICKKALFRYADGMPLVWLSKLLPGNSLAERVTGADLLPAVCELAASKYQRVYFLGGNPGVADRAAQELMKRHIGLNVVGTYCPPLGFEHNDDETARIIADINERGVDLLFIGVGAPKQEKWASRNLERLTVGPVVCIGAAFDFVAGDVRRAPVCLQKWGLEWLWRLFKEPKRLWRRYLLRDSRFFVLALKEISRSWLYIRR